MVVVVVMVVVVFVVVVVVVVVVLVVVVATAAVVAWIINMDFSIWLSHAPPCLREPGLCIAACTKC